MAFTARSTMPAAKPSKVKLVVTSGEAGKTKAGQKIIGPKREKELKKVISNYERRYKRRVKKTFGEVTWDTVNKYSRTQNRSVALVIDLSTVKSLKAYKNLINWLNYDKTKQFKAELTHDRRSWMTKLLENGYNLDAKTAPELFDVINHMTADDILAWQTRNPELVRKLFYKYDYIWDSMNREEYIPLVNSLIESINVLKGTNIPLFE